MNVQLSPAVHDGLREVQVLQILIRKARYNQSAGKYKTHAVNVIIWDPVRQEERPIEFSLFGKDKGNAGSLGWLRWTDERMDIVRATAPKTVIVRIVPDRFNPAVPFFYLTKRSREEWCDRIRNYVPDMPEPDPVEVARDSAVVIVQQAWLPGLAAELVVSR